MVPKTTGTWSDAGCAVSSAWISMLFLSALNRLFSTITRVSVIGRDPLIGGPRDLPSRYEGVDFGLLDIAIPAIPPRRGTVAPGDDPVRFGRSDTITFTPRGTASSGTLFISDGRSLVVAVVLYGHTGRVRTWRYLRDGGGWSR